MLSITILGTAGSAPTKDRALPSVAIEYNGSIYLFDCGEGTQSQFIKYSLNPSKLHSIFLTHLHGDHVIGIAGLVRTLALNNRTKPLYIFVPEGEENGIKALMTFDRALLSYPIIIEGIKSGQVMKNKEMTISAFRVNHSIKTYGYVFKENDKLRFNKQQCSKLGIKGTMFAQLEKGKVLTIKGKRISIKGVTKPQKGRKIVYIADTRPSNESIKASMDADILIHEATYSENLKNLAMERKHSTAKEAARVAKLSRSKALILFHMSARYKNPNVILKEAKSVFKKTRVAYDGMKINL